MTDLNGRTGPALIQHGNRVSGLSIPLLVALLGLAGCSGARPLPSVVADRCYRVVLGTWTAPPDSPATRPDPVVPLHGIVVRFSTTAFAIPPVLTDSFRTRVLRWTATERDSVLVNQSSIGMEGWGFALATDEDPPRGEAYFYHDSLGDYRAPATAQEVECGAETAVAEYDYR